MKHPTHQNDISKYWSNHHSFEPLPTDYPTWPAQKKREFLWNQGIVPSQYDHHPPLKKTDTIGLFLTPLSIKMNRSSDQSPENWRKAIHARGSVAQVGLIPTSNSLGLTGLFQGADYGLLRASLTEDPAQGDVAPGLGLKLLVDGRPSANVSALVSLVGQGQDYNFFANEFSNIVPVVNQLRPKLANFIFRRVTRYPTRLSMAYFGAIKQTGDSIAHPAYPERIYLKPNPDLKFSSNPHDFRVDLESIAVGTVLFTVYAVDPELAVDLDIDAPEYRQYATDIGQIITQSPFITSFYGDSHLFFRHHRFHNQ